VLPAPRRHCSRRQEFETLGSVDSLVLVGRRQGGDVPVRGVRVAEKDRSVGGASPCEPGRLELEAAPRARREAGGENEGSPNGLLMVVSIHNKYVINSVKI
jgi:hypothetical protein